MKSKRLTSRRGIVLIALAILVLSAGVPAIRQLSAWHHRIEIRDANRRLRERVFQSDFDGAVSAWKQLPPGLADAPEVKAWYLYALAGRPGRPLKERLGEAVRLARELTAREPSDPWSWFALAAVLTYGGDGEALQPSEKALAMMPRNPDFLWVRAKALFTDYDHVEKVVTFVDQHRHEVENPADLLVVKAGAQNFLGSQVHNDPELVAAALATLQEARRLDPDNYRAQSMTGLYLKSGGEPEKALPFTEAAMKLAPDSILAHTEYWRTFAGLDPSQQSARRQSTERDVDGTVARNPDHPWVLTRAADAYGTLGRLDKERELEERVLREYPDSQWEVDTVVASRLQRMAQALDLWNPERKGDALGGPEMRLEPAEERPAPGTVEREMSGGFEEFLWSYVEKPHPENTWTLEHAYIVLFEMARTDPSYDAKKLEKIVQGLADHTGFSLSDDDTRGVIELANRGIALDHAEKIAATALDNAEKKLAEKKRDPDAIYLQVTHERVAGLHDALGWVLLKRGRIDAAEKELQQAHEMNPGYRENLYHRAELAVARGDFPRAEGFLEECALIPPQNDNPCTPALKDLYRQRHSGMTGYEMYAQAVLAKGNALRKERLLASRIQPPKAILPFRFKSLDGTTFSSDDLKGQVAVIDFWGVWCPSCIAAMPDFQKLAEKYRDDPQVAIVSINVFDPAPVLEKWLKKNPVAFPILRESDYVDKAKVDTFPTTWFLDREGHLHYTLSGNGGDLVEEDSWLIEELKRR